MQWTGSDIRSARAKRGWTQAKFATELGAGLRTVASWERDEARPQAHWIERLNEVFPDEAPTATDGLPDSARDPRLSDADFIELLEEIARRYTRARAEAPLIGAIDTEQDRNAAGEVFEWDSADAPSARRKTAQTAQPQGGQAL